MVELEPNLEINNGGAQLEQAVMLSAFKHSTTEGIKGMKDLFLHKYQNETRATLLVENKVGAHDVWRRNNREIKPSTRKERITKESNQPLSPPHTRAFCLRQSSFVQLALRKCGRHLERFLARMNKALPKVTRTVFA